MSINRRDFIGGVAVGAAVGVAGTYMAMKGEKAAPKLVEAPTVSKAQTVVLKVQAAWGGGIFLEDAKNYVTRVNEMAGKDLKIDLLSVNSVVKTS